MHCTTYYRPGPVDGIYNHPWVKDMVVAKCRIQWANNIGKYNAPLLNGGTINYSEIQSQGQQDEERLNQELLDRWSPPLAMMIG